MTSKHDTDLVRKAFEVAKTNFPRRKQQRNGSKSIEVIAKVEKIPHRLLVSAVGIWRYGSEADVEKACSGAQGIHSIYHSVLAEWRKKRHADRRLSERSRNIKAGQRSSERVATLMIHNVVWRQLRESLLGLTTLPAPAEVMDEIVIRNEPRVSFIKDRLDTVIHWLEEARDVIRRTEATNAKKSGGHRPDPRNGRRPVG